MTTGKPKYDFRDAVPDDLAEVERQIEYWMSRQNEGEPLSNWEGQVKTKLEQLRWKEQQLVRSATNRAKSAASEGSPLIFLSCGQHSDEEKNLGREVKKLLEENGAPEVWFAENQSSLSGLTNNILGALNRSVGFIGIMHKRGQVETPMGTSTTRASVWIEQEIATGAFIAHVLGRQIEVVLYTQEGISLEGMREKLQLNPHVFKTDQEVLEHLRKDLQRWRSVGSGAINQTGFDEAFNQRLQSVKSDFFVRSGRPRKTAPRSPTYFLACLSPMNSTQFEIDVNVRNEFIVDMYGTFPGHRALEQHQGKPLELEVAVDGAAEVLLPIESHSEERRWRLNQRGEIGFVTQSVSGSDPRLWSAYDVAQDLLSSLSLAERFWKARGYKGTGRLSTELSVGDAELAIRNLGFPALFYQQTTALDELFLDRNSILPSNQARARALDEVDFQIASLGDAKHEIAAKVLGRLLRGLCHDVDLIRLQRSFQNLSTSDPVRTLHAS